MAVQIAHVAMYDVQTVAKMPRRVMLTVNSVMDMCPCMRTFFPSTQSHSCHTPTAAVLRPRGWVAAKKILLYTYEFGMMGCVL